MALITRYGGTGIEPYSLDRRKDAELVARNPTGITVYRSVEEVRRDIPISALVPLMIDNSPPYPLVYNPPRTMRLPGSKSCCSGCGDRISPNTGGFNYQGGAVPAISIPREQGSFLFPNLGNWLGSLGGGNTYSAPVVPNNQAKQDAISDENLISGKQIIQALIASVVVALVFYAWKKWAV